MVHLLVYGPGAK